MAYFRTRRTRNLIITAVIAAAVVVGVWALNARLMHSAYVTGWVLILMVLFLAGYNLRKKLPFIPLGASAKWLQWHIYVGLTAIVVFALHAFVKLDGSIQTPNGYLEGVLAVIFIFVAASGVFGLFLTRTIPARLTVRNEEFIFERIPGFRKRLGDEARQLVLQAVASSDTTTLADYYSQRLSLFFEKPRNYWHHLFQSSGPRHKLLTELTDLDRYLSDTERPIAGDLATLVATKDDLDYHYALQLTLKCWLFAHIGFTYALVLLAVAHAVLTYAFSGAAL